MNDKNLIPQAHKLTVEDQSKGGIASGEARRKRKQMRDDLQALLDSEQTFSDGKVRRVQEGIVHKLVKAAMSGDLKAIDQVAKLMGEYENKVKLEGSVEQVQIVVDDPEAATALSKIINRE